MTAPAQQPEYIIDEELAALIEDALTNNPECKKCPNEGSGFNGAIVSHLRTRPHPPAPYTVEQVAEIDKRIRQVARAATLATLKTLVSRCEDVSTTGQNEYKLMGWVPIEAIKGIAETLQKQIGEKQ